MLRLSRRRAERTSEKRQAEFLNHSLLPHLLIDYQTARGLESEPTSRTGCIRVAAR